MVPNSEQDKRNANDEIKAVKLSGNSPSVVDMPNNKITPAHIMQMRDKSTKEQSSWNQQQVATALNQNFGSMQQSLNQQSSPPN